jgi:hypothetical protein
MNIESRSESLSSFIIRFSLFSVPILSSSFNLGLSLKTIGNFLADLSQSQYRRDLSSRRARRDEIKSPDQHLRQIHTQEVCRSNRDRIIQRDCTGRDCTTFMSYLTALCEIHYWSFYQYCVPRRDLDAT